MDVKKAKDQQASSSRGARREQETAARTGGYDDEQVSDIRAVNHLVHNESFRISSLEKCTSCN